MLEESQNKHKQKQKIRYLQVYGGSEFQSLEQTGVGVFYQPVGMSYFQQVLELVNLLHSFIGKCDVGQ